MNPTAIASDEQTGTGRRKSHTRYSYQKVLDGRKQPIRGLWRRNGSFVARLTVENDNGFKETRWVPLATATTVPQAQAELRQLQTHRENNSLPVLRRTPKLADYSAEYFAYYEAVKDAKRPATITKEKGCMELWKAHLGETRLDHINMAKINSFIAKRQAAGISGRTVNLDVIALRNVLKRAIGDGWLKVLPMQNLKPLKWTARKRELVTMAEIARITEAGFKKIYYQGRLAGEGEEGQALKNAQQFSDYVWLLAFTGARRNEGLRLRWADVDFERKQITIGSDGLAKNRLARVVDFHPKLENHLLDMKKRRAPDSQWLFPSPQRGDKDASTKTLMESLRLARNAAKMAHFGFHDCRHFFISYAVMSGIDYMTIAKWVGHKDGGILIGKVYGHLSNEHARAQAARLNFGPTVVPMPQAVTG